MYDYLLCHHCHVTPATDLLLLPPPPPPPLHIYVVDRAHMWNLRLTIVATRRGFYDPDILWNSIDIIHVPAYSSTIGGFYTDLMGGDACIIHHYIVFT